MESSSAQEENKNKEAIQTVPFQENLKRNIDATGGAPSAVRPVAAGRATTLTGLSGRKHKLSLASSLRQDKPKLQRGASQNVPRQHFQRQQQATQHQALQQPTQQQQQSYLAAMYQPHLYLQQAAGMMPASLGLNGSTVRNSCGSTAGINGGSIPAQFIPTQQLLQQGQDGLPNSFAMPSQLMKGLPILTTGDTVIPNGNLLNVKHVGNTQFSQ